jgi:hypothetical protein
MQASTYTQKQMKKPAINLDEKNAEALLLMKVIVTCSMLTDLTTIWPELV